MNMIDRLFALRASQPFAELRDTELVLIASAARPKSYQPGEVIGLAGRPLRHLYVVVKGGAVFSDDTIVRLAGAKAGGSTLKVGWVLVGFEMEIWDGSRSIRSSPVHSIIVEYRRP